MHRGRGRGGRGGGRKRAAVEHFDGDVDAIHTSVIRGIYDPLEETDADFRSVPKFDDEVLRCACLSRRRFLHHCVWLTLVLCGCVAVVCASRRVARPPLRVYVTGVVKSVL